MISKTVTIHDPFKFSFIAIALLALVLRCVIVYSADWRARSDAKDYHELAINLMEGNGYVNYFNEHPAYEGFVQRAYRPPGYPFLLAAIYILFHFNPQTAMLVNVLCEMLTLILLYKLASYYMGKKIALIPAVAYALCPTWTANLMTESSFTLMFVAAIYMLVQRRWLNSMALSSVLGGIICFAIMLKPIGVVLFIPVGVELLKSRSLKLVRYIIPVCLFTLIYLTVWVGRNYRLYHTVMLTSNANQHIAASYGIDHVQIMTALRNTYQRVPNEAELNNYIGGLIKTAKEATPGLAARVYLQHFRGLFDLHPAWELNDWLWPEIFRKHPHVCAGHRFLYKIHYILYPLGFFGFVVLCLSKRCIPIITVIAAFLLLHPLVSPGNIRFMAPMVPLLCYSTGVLVFVICAGLSNKQKQFAPEPQGTAGVWCDIT